MFMDMDMDSHYGDQGGDSVPLFLGGARGWCSDIIYIQLLSTNSQKGVSKYTQGAE